MRALAAIAMIVPLLWDGAQAAPLTAEPPPANPTASYRASGNEPFWSMTIADGRIVIERPGVSARELVAPERQAVDNGYRFQSDAIAIEITHVRCEDTMSGAPFTDRVTVTLDGQRLEGCGGTRLPPARIEGTHWIVVSLDGAAVTLDPPPTLDIDEQGRVSGSDGCNRFVGGLAFASESVKTDGMGAGTMMACPDEQTQVAETYNALRAKVTAWRFEEGNLVLSTADQRAIRLRQTL